MYDFPETWRCVLRAILEAPVAWRSLEEVAEAVGRPIDAVADVLADLDVAGWIAVWEREDGPAVTLTCLAAERFGVHLVEIGAAMTPRWWPIGDPQPAAPKARRVIHNERASSLEFLVDPAIPAEELVAIAELAAGPKPTLLIGQGLSPWPGPSGDRSLCPACRGRRLPNSAYCLRCDRWGLDARFNPDATPPATARDLARSVGSARRKAEARLSASQRRRKLRLRERLQSQ